MLTTLANEGENFVSSVTPAAMYSTVQLLLPRAPADMSTLLRDFWFSLPLHDFSPLMAGCYVYTQVLQTRIKYDLQLIQANELHLKVSCRLF